MLIREEQIRSLRSAAVSGFQQRAADYLRAKEPDRWAQATDRELAAFVLSSEVRGYEFGLRTEQSIVCIAHIRTRIGDDWSDPKWDWVPKMLGDKEYGPNFRAKLALQTVLDLTGKP